VSDAASYFDTLGEGEWDRLEATLHGRVKYAIHRRFLDEHVHAGMSVLDAGSGPGRFAIDAARTGARVTLLDISPVQLDLARLRLAAAGCSADSFDAGDVRSLPYPTASFDAVIAYGGAISYSFDQYSAAITELVRVCRPGGVLLVSVMSLWGILMLAGPLDATNFLARMGEHLAWDVREPPPGVVLTQPGSDEFHLPMALFSSAGLRHAMESAGCEVLRMAAANPISRAGLPLANVSADEVSSARLTGLELAMCEQPGVVDSGEHLLAVARKYRT
jgi:SAM-dependent methyltransferase